LNSGDGLEDYVEEDFDINEETNEDFIESDEVFSKDELFQGLKAPFEIRAKLPVPDPKNPKKTILKRAKFILRIPRGEESGAIFRRAKKTQDTVLQDQLIARVFVKPKFSSKEVKALPTSFKAKILNIVNERCFGVSLSDMQNKEVDDF
jgi:hypothetical protein